jgi:soluble lytic murein transglycosylase-like protein
VIELIVKTALLIGSVAPQLGGPVIAEYAVCSAAASTKHQIPVERLVAVVQHESQWRADVISPTADYGLGQLHRTRPTAAERAALLDGCTNLDLTAEFLATRGLRAYNPGNPRHFGSVSRIEKRLRSVLVQLDRKKKIEPMSISVVRPGRFQ